MDELKPARGRTHELPFAILPFHHQVSGRVRAMFDMNWKHPAFPVAIHPIANGRYSELDGDKRSQSNEPATRAAQEPTAWSASGSRVRRRKRRSVSR